MCQVFADSEVCIFNFGKSEEQKTCGRNFQIRKYAFFNIWKSDEQKVVSEILRFVSMLF